MKKYPNIIACRHGLSLANKLGDGTFIADKPKKNTELLLLEDFQVPLVEEGITQARELGRFLRENFGLPDVVLDSGYRRAMETRAYALEAGYSQKEIGRMIIRSDDRFRERECGTLRRVPKKERERIPYWTQFQKDWKTNPYQSRPINGESIADMEPRTRQAILEVADLYRGKVVFIFCHGHTLHAIQIPMDGLSVEESNEMLKNGWVDNCTVHFYKGKKHGWKKMQQFDPLAKS